MRPTSGSTILTMDEDYLGEIVFDKVLEETGLNFGDVAHDCGRVQHSSLRHLEIAMKTVCSTRSPLHDEAQRVTMQGSLLH